MVREGLPIRAQPNRSRPARLFVVAGVCAVVVLCLVGLGRQSTSSFVTDGTSRHLSQTSPTSTPANRQSSSVARAFSSLSTLGSVLGTGSQQAGSGRQYSSPDSLGPTLVLYAYTTDDPVHTANFAYFVRWGMGQAQGLDYLVAVRKQDMESLPALPPQAQYWQAPVRGCKFHWGLLSEAVKAGKASKAKYQYFVLLSSAVRGPFIPPYQLESSEHWTRAFLQRLHGFTKLVGPTISCEGPAVQNVNRTAPLVDVPYVEFGLLATDVTGLDLMEKEASVFQCQNETKRVQTYGVMGASRAIFRAGFSIDSFMMRYRGIDWTNQSNWDCNGRVTPGREFYYDGITLNPFEVMFVPMDTIAVENGWTFAKLASVYASWLSIQDAGRLHVGDNAWVEDPWPPKRQRIAYVQSRGPGCFDTHYYQRQNDDLKVLSEPLQLWDHFVTMGQFEGRSFRWSCQDDRKLPWEF